MLGRPLSGHGGAFMSLLSVHTRPSPAGVLIVVAGEIDATNAGHLESVIGRERRPGTSLILDLGGLTFLDGLGLHVLLRAHADVRREGGTLHLADVRDRPARILRVTGVWDTLNIHSDVRAATAAVGRSPWAEPAGEHAGA